MVSAAGPVFRPELAGLWGGSTLRGWRGRGIYRALVGDPAASGLPGRHDDDPLRLDAGPRAGRTLTTSLGTPVADSPRYADDPTR